MVGLSDTAILDKSRNVVGIIGIGRDISQPKQVEKEALIAELRGALEIAETPEGLLPICASCKKVKDDRGYWK